MGAQRISPQNGLLRLPKRFKNKGVGAQNYPLLMDFGARQNALKTNGWEPQNIPSKMDFGARQNALKNQGMGARGIPLRGIPFCLCV